MVIVTEFVGLGFIERNAFANVTMNKIVVRRTNNGWMICMIPLSIIAPFSYHTVVAVKHPLKMIETSHAMIIAVHTFF